MWDNSIESTHKIKFSAKNNKKASQLSSCLEWWNDINSLNVAQIYLMWSGDADRPIQHPIKEIDQNTVITLNTGISTPNHTYKKLNKFTLLPADVSKNCWMSSKQCRLWSDATFCDI